MQNPLTYRPGRALRTTSGEKTKAIAVWVGWGIAAALGATHFHFDAFERVFVIIAGPVGYTSLVKTRLRGYDSETRNAQTALKNGRPKEAEEEFTTVGGGFRWPRIIGRINDYNRAMAALKQGKLTAAIELLVSVEERGGVIKLDGAIASNLAYLHALAGNVELATDWQSEAVYRFKRYTKTPPFPGLLSEVAVDLRRGEAARVRKMLDDQWVHLERELTGERMRPVRLFRAFAIAQTSDVRDAAAVGPHLAALGPVSAGEFTYLATQWPELAAFLAAHLH
jgi:hypothetical protein